MKCSWEKHIERGPQFSLLSCLEDSRYRAAADRENWEIETEVRDVDRIRVTKVYCSGLLGDGGVGGHKSTPSNILFPPASSSPLITARVGTWERSASNNTVFTVPQSVRYHKLPPPRVLLLVCCQPGHATWRCGSNVYVWNVFYCDSLSFSEQFTPVLLLYHATVYIWTIDWCIVN